MVEKSLPEQDCLFKAFLDIGEKLKATHRHRPISNPPSTDALSWTCSIDRPMGYHGQHTRLAH